MKTSRSNFLCGFMGAGKSTLIKEINSKENIDCMDLDFHIENLYGPINKIFEDKDIDLIIISTRHDTHAKYIIKSLNVSNFKLEFSF